MYANERDLRQHQRLLNEITTPNYTCDTCKKSFKTAFTLRLHLNVNFETKKYNCDKCDKSYTSNKPLWLHKKTIHKNIKEIHECDMCEKVFNQKRSLRKHISAIHYGEMQYVKCDKCEKLFTDSSSRNKHVKAIHNKLKDHKCGICTMAFTLPHHLRNKSKKYKIFIFFLFSYRKGKEK